MTDPYLQRAYAAVEAARKKRADYKGACSECAYSRASLTDRICEHPAVVLVAFNLTDDYAKQRIVQCGEQRDKGSLYGPVVCGPGGALFEKRVGLFARIVGAFDSAGI